MEASQTIRVEVSSTTSPQKGRVIVHMLDTKPPFSHELPMDTPNLLQGDICLNPRDSSWSLCRPNKDRCAEKHKHKLFSTSIMGLLHRRSALRGRQAAADQLMAKDPSRCAVHQRNCASCLWLVMVTTRGDNLSLQLPAFPPGSLHWLHWLAEGTLRQPV